MLKLDVFLIQFNTYIIDRSHRKRNLPKRNKLCSTLVKKRISELVVAENCLHRRTFKFSNHI